MKLADYHIHSRYSLDSKATLEDIADYAMAKNLKEIVITDHFEPTARDREYLNYDPIDQRRTIERLNDRLQGKLIIRQGVELGQPHLYPDLIQDVKEKVNFDYIIGSTHKDSRDVDASELHYDPKNLDAISKKYLQEVLSMVKDDAFDCIGHLDLIKRYASRKGVALSIASYREQLEEIFKILIRNGKGIEINTSGLRESMKTCMPDIDILGFYKDLGGEIVTLGSDAHLAKDVGEGLTFAADMLRDAGFRYVTVYNKRVPDFETLTDRDKYYQMVG